MRVLVYERKSGCVYHGTCEIPDKSVVILKNVVRRRSAYVNYEVFRQGHCVVHTESMEYGEKHHDIMVSIESVFVELLSDNERVEWAGLTEERANELLEEIKAKADKQCKEDEEKYYAGKSKLAIFFMKIFN